MQIKVIWKEAGGHVHCRVFQGRGEDMTWQKAGDLAFDSEGFKAFTDCMQGKGVFVLEGEDRPVDLVFITGGCMATVVEIRGLTPKGDQWLKDHVQAAYRLGVYTVEKRYVNDIYVGAQNDGLSVTQKEK